MRVNKKYGAITHDSNIGSASCNRYNIPMPRIRAASVQTDPQIGQVQRNLEVVLSHLNSIRADLLVFPECALTGYGFDTRVDAWHLAEPIPGPSTERISAECQRANRWVIVGMLEADLKGNLFNSAAFIGPQGIVGTYRKVHLPHLGVDRFATPGDKGFPVFDVPFGRVGILICYDGGFPEAARVLKLGGAQMICLPTNWPEGAEVSCQFLPMVRAHENHINFLSANRVGNESGFRFLGGSKICDDAGRVLAEAGDREKVISAELDLDRADQNRVINIPGRYEVDRIGHRRPDLYGPIVSASSSQWGTA